MGVRFTSLSVLLALALSGCDQGPGELARYTGPGTRHASRAHRAGASATRVAGGVSQADASVPDAGPGGDAGGEAAAGTSAEAGPAGSSADAGTVRVADASSVDASRASVADARATDDRSVAPDGGTARTVWDWNGVIGTGQSLAVGGWAFDEAPDLTTVSLTQPYRNLKLFDATPYWPDAGVGPYSLDGSGVYSVVPLVEPIRVGPLGDDLQYPDNILNETPQSGMANEMTFLSLGRGGPSLVSVHSAVGTAGAVLADIDKQGDGKAYPAGLMEARVLRRLADQAGLSFGYQAVVLTHGEGDATNPEYEAGLHQLALDYDADLRQITGQTQAIPLILTQQSTAPETGPPLSALEQWRASLDYPHAIVCAGPKYQYNYVSDAHMDGPSYRRLGEKYAEVLDALNRGVDWQPLQPLSATLRGDRITIVFHVPTPPLEWDTTLPTPHATLDPEWAGGRGFEVAGVVDGGEANLTITSATITGDSVILGLSAVPPSGNLVVRYAITKDTMEPDVASATARRGQLRDSNDIVGYDAVSLDVVVTQGSDTIKSVAPGAFTGRSAREIVTHPALPTNTIIRTRPDPSTAVLSTPWPGPTGVATVRLHNSLHNYAVHFELPVAR